MVRNIRQKNLILNHCLQDVYINSNLKDLENLIKKEKFKYFESKPKYGN